MTDIQVLEQAIAKLHIALERETAARRAAEAERDKVRDERTAFHRRACAAEAELAVWQSQATTAKPRAPRFAFVWNVDGGTFLTHARNVDEARANMRRAFGTDTFSSWSHSPDVWTDAADDTATNHWDWNV